MARNVTAASPGLNVLLSSETISLAISGASSLNVT
jgi:hypothetical protein